MMQDLEEVLESILERVLESGPAAGFAILMVGLIIWLLCWTAIFRKAGYASWLAVFMIIPGVNMLAFLVFAIAKWPVLARQAVRSVGPVEPAPGMARTIAPMAVPGAERPRTRCAGCGSQLAPNDRFCGICGSQRQGA